MTPTTDAPYAPMTAPPTATDPLSHYAARFDALRTGPTAGPAWLAAIRETAARRFLADGFPTIRDEEFRFTNVSPIAERAFGAAPKTDLAAARALKSRFVVPGLDAYELVFVNGRFVSALSNVEALPKGVRVTSLASVLEGDTRAIEPWFGHAIKFEMKGFTALNTALATDGAVVMLQNDVVLERPIHLLFLTDTSVPAGSHLRSLILAGRHSQAHIVETYAGAEGQEYFTNALTEVIGGEGSQIEHCRVQRESLAAYHVSSTHLHLSRGAVFASENVAFGGAIVRNDVNALLDAEGINCTLNGLYLVDDRRLVDNHTTIDHAKPHCESHELYKGILDDHGRGVFNGKIFVREDAQKTDAKQTNQILLLSDDATIDTKPQLEIFADDVKCTHGATVGRLAQDQLFYLQARGIAEEHARAILIHAFASDIVARIEVEPLRNYLEQILVERLPMD
jgi:Fe-S cluster assembly protein SufD